MLSFIVVTFINICVSTISMHIPQRIHEPIFPDDLRTKIYHEDGDVFENSMHSIKRDIVKK